MHKIVLVDDESWALVYLKKIFSRTDLWFEVAGTASSAAMAVNVIRKTHPDVLITDIQLPNCSGLELLRHLREDGYTGEAVIVSAYQEFHYAKEAFRYGVFDYCVKPIGRDAAENLLKQLAIKLQEKEKGTCQEGFREQAYPAGEKTDEALAFWNLVAYIKNHYMEKLLIRDLANEYAFSPNYCSSLFVKNVGMTFSQYLTKLRMEQAAELVRTTLFSTGEIAAKVGYEDETYFYKVFKKYYGVSPVRFRNGPASSTCCQIYDKER